VGLIICKSTDKTVVEWSLKGINKPLGVSTYQLEQVVERTVRELEQRKGEGRVRRGGICPHGNGREPATN